MKKITAPISTDDGLTIVDVSTLTDAQVRRAVDLTAEGDSGCREDAHSAMTSASTERDYLAAFCRNHDAADLGAFVTDIGNPTE